MTIPIIVGDFHKDIADEMVRAATAELEKAGAEVEVWRLSGSYEAPLIADRLLAKSETDAVAVLGYIEKGETLHGEVMGHVVHQTLTDLSIKHQKPVGMGIIGPGATREQALKRQEDAAQRAVQAVLGSLEQLKKI